MGTISDHTRATRNTTGVSDALFTKTQQRVLGILFATPNRNFYESEIIRLAGGGRGAVQRELTKLEKSGLVIAHRIGKQKHYRPNTKASVFKPLRELILKTAGVADVIRAALSPLAAQIRVAFIYGSVASGNDRGTSDIDIMVLSDHLTYRDLFGALETASKWIGRAVNPTLYTKSEWDARLRKRNAFVSRVYGQKRIRLLGDEAELATF
jgi:predicted nucleotidyltransferase